MVLFKRKPVHFLQPADDIPDNAEVWHITQTGELFDTYEDYLERIDFYKQRRFICQITGHSGLTFFEALQSELAGAEEVEQAFPEALKGPVLRKVQFQTISRIDNLVDTLYDEFKADYYPGEQVTVLVVSGDRLHGVVREKTRFGSKVLPDGTLTPPFSRYFVSLDDQEGEEAVVDDAHIFRDRKIFTKSVLRSFIKKTVTREAWTGAPWLVRNEVAAQYHIDTRVPPHLRYDTKVMERKQIQAQKRRSEAEANGYDHNGPMRLPELKPAPKSHKAKHLQKGRLSGGYGNSQNPFQFPSSLRDQGLSPPSFAHPDTPPPPPPPKYPIEDLQLEPQGVVRPALRFMCNDPPQPVESLHSSPIQMKSVGPLLETWDTLNVYCEIFQLDSFTFDDFVEAMQIASEKSSSELFDEIHCAVLKILVNSESDGGKVQVQLPELESEEEEDDEEEEEGDGEEGDETANGLAVDDEIETKPSGRATRSSLAKQEAERLAAEAAEKEKEIQEAEQAARHRAEQVLEGYDWVENLRQRKFQHGGWEMMVVGLLHQLSKSERHHAACEELLLQIVPPEENPSQETVRQHYLGLDINARVQILQIMCILTSETKAVRGYMEDCSEQMTAYRKEKIEWQRQRKQGLEELRSLHDQRKIMLPDNMPPSPPLEPTDVNGDVKMEDAEEIPADISEENVASSSDDVPKNRNLRRAQDRAAERKRKQEKEEQMRKQKAEAAAKAPKQSKQFLKVLKDIEKKEEQVKKCEEEIATIENDLREADCPRTRVLGKDRFWNRYYWFERNGMPYGGLPDSSTAAAEYANGCIWVQGPDELERQGYIDMIPEYQNEYKSKFGMTVPDRKRLEEGATSVFNARQWGYYAEPADVDALLEWLDPRGFNELKLRKEIVNYKDKIIKNMENRKAYLAGPEKEKLDADEPQKPPKRMTTRGRTGPSAQETRSYRCQAWHNTMAVEELGHLHSDPPPPAPPAAAGRARKQSAKKQEASVDVSGPRSTRKLTRQGSRYNF